MAEYITVKEFAQLAGMTRQAVYKAINGKLSNYVNVVNGQKVISVQALKDFYGIEVDKKLFNETTRFNQPDNRQEQALTAAIAALTAQLEAKDRQIETLTAALADTTTALKTAQALHAGTIQERLTAQAETQPQSDTEPQEAAQEPEADQEPIEAEDAPQAATGATATTHTETEKATEEAEALRQRITELEQELAAAKQQQPRRGFFARLFGR